MPIKLAIEENKLEWSLRRRRQKSSILIMLKTGRKDDLQDEAKNDIIDDENPPGRLSLSDENSEA